MSEFDDVRQSLRDLGRRVARGEIDEPTFDRLREKVLSHLGPAERAQLGLASVAGSTPVPATPAPATPFPAGPVGPSGARGRGVGTRVASLSQLDLTPGTILMGQWRVERELGRGGFGVVLEAENLSLHERQAVKLLDPAMVERRDLLDRFRREVRATRRLAHARIVSVFDYREDLEAGLALFSMECVEGSSVAALLARSRERREPVPVPLALTILSQVMEALEAAHEAGVIHRDVTPANILLEGSDPDQLLRNAWRDPKVKLVDFGIAGAIERTELSQRSRVLGTAAYVAPEVLDPAAEVTPAADVYGAGAVFYELVTGKLPLGRFEDPSALRAGLPLDLDQLALDLLQAGPSRRPLPRNARDRIVALVATCGRPGIDRGQTTGEPDPSVLDTGDLAVLIVPSKGLWRRESYFWERGRLFRLAFQAGTSDLDHELIPVPEDPLSPVGNVTDLWRRWDGVEFWIVSYPPGFGSGQATRRLLGGQAQKWRDRSRCNHALDHGALGYEDYLSRYTAGSTREVILVFAGRGETTLCLAEVGEGVAEVQNKCPFEVLSTRAELRPKLESTLSKFYASRAGDAIGDVVLFGPRSDELHPVLVSLLPARRPPVRIPDLERRGMISLLAALVGDRQDSLLLASLEHAMGVRFREAVRVAGSEDVIPAETFVRVVEEATNIPVLKEESFTPVEPTRFPAGTLCEVFGSSVLPLAELPAVPLDQTPGARIVLRLDLDADRCLRWSLRQDADEERRTLATGVL